MRVVNSEQSRLWDAETIERIGISGAVLMERASLGVVAAFEAFFEPPENATIGIICGPGNNGGDGFAVARILAEDEYLVRLFYVTDPNGLTGDAKTNFEICINLGLEMQQVRANLEVVESANCDYWIDALFGTGLNRDIEEGMQEWVAFLNRRDAVFSIDVPSGLNCETGQACGAMVWADATATFAAPKLGLVLEPGRSAAGELFVVEIGIPELVKQDVGWAAEWLVEPRDISSRPARYHKGDAGRVALVAGDLPGAIFLAAKASLKSGAGLVKVVSEKRGWDGTSPELMVTDDLETTVPWADVIVVGPGLGTDSERKRSFLFAWENARVVVADADALNLLSENSAFWELRSGTAVITPHPGEMSRLTQMSVQEVLDAPVKTARDFAKKRGCIVVLKTEATVVANPTGWVAINATGNPGMATAGTGDVLSGIIAARLADGFRDPFEAVCDAVCAHGGAGDRAVVQVGEIGMTASDLIESLGSVWADWESA